MLEGCLSAYCSPNAPDIPVLQNASADTRAKAESLLAALEGINGPYHFELVECAAELGGGTLPGTEIKSHGVAVVSEGHTASELEKRLRMAEVPVICRVHADKVVLDVIAVEERDFHIIINALNCGI
jgi:L-seryl-tRNA(Ser) seleniumtransferase